MRFKRLSALVAMLLCLVLLCSCSLPFDFPFNFGSGSSDAGGQQEPQRERRTIPFSQMTYERPDVEHIKARTIELTEALKNAADFDEVMQIDNEVSELFEHFNTMHTLASLATSRDVNDSYMDEEYRYLNDQGVELSLLGNAFNEQLVYGPFADDYRNEVGDFVFTSIQNSLLLNSEAVADFKKERSELEVDYDQWYTTLSVEYEGQEYTIDEIYAIDSSSLRMQLRSEYYAAYRDQYADMLLRMVELDKLTAYELGFASVPDMYYLAYDRDYTPNDARTLCENIQRYFVPLLPTAYSAFFGGGGVDYDTAMDELPSALSAVSPELQEVWEDMMDYGLYDFKPRNGKSTSSQFCTTISGFDAPFIFTYWRDDFTSLSTTVHEFGHFYDAWLHYDSYGGNNLDIAEVYSQALELLMFPTYGRIIDYAAEAELDTLASMLVNSLVFQCVLEDFQLRMHELETFDADILSALYGQVLADYGLGGGGPDGTWMEIFHIFGAPFYTISYVTSAIAALQIWAIGQDDWDEGVQVYLDLIHSNQEQPFTRLLENVGLAPVHQRSTLQQLASHFEEAFSSGLRAA